MIDKIKKHDNFIIFIITILMTMGTYIYVCTFIESGDNIWNFNNIYKMYNGYKIYTDMNVIISPMFFYIVNFIFHIIGANILPFAISGILIYSFTNTFIYIVLKSLKINKKNAFSYLMIIQAIVYSNITGGANYNYLAITFTIIGLFLLIHLKSNYLWILQGLIIYLVIFTKQNIGVYYSIAVITIEIILNKINKKTVNNIIKQFVLAIILLGVNLYILFLQGSLYDFINLTILGIGEFAQNFFIDIYIILLIGMDIICVTTIIFMKKNNLFNKEQYKNLVILSVFSIMMSFVVYPIMNEYHILLAIIIPLIELFYILDFTIFKEFNVNNILFIVGIIIYITFFIISCNNANYWINNAKFDVSYKYPYYGGIVNKEDQTKIETIDNYITQQENNGKKIIILSHEAGVYMIPLNKNNGVFDLPFKGNLGKDGEKGLVKKITELEDCKILLKKGNLFWQESEKVNEYIKQNYTKIGEIENFEIYE